MPSKKLSLNLTEILPALFLHGCANQKIHVRQHMRSMAQRYSLEQRDELSRCWPLIKEVGVRDVEARFHLVRAASALLPHTTRFCDARTTLVYIRYDL